MKTETEVGNQYVIVAHRSCMSVCGGASALLKQNDSVRFFDSEAEARKYCEMLNQEVKSGYVWYTVANAEGL